MIVGVGTDLCLISRMRKVILSQRFIEKNFVPEEIEYAQRHGDPALHFASAFAAKEAFAKAGGWGLSKIGLKNCWVERTEEGPFLRWSESLNEKISELRGIRCHLSLSHEGDFALAFVVLEEQYDFSRDASSSPEKKTIG